MKKRAWIIVTVTVLLALVAGSSFAQGSSYLDTLYNADETSAESDGSFATPQSGNDDGTTTEFAQPAQPQPVMMTYQAALFQQFRNVRTRIGGFFQRLFAALRQIFRIIRGGRPGPIAQPGPAPRPPQNPQPGPTWPPVVPQPPANQPPAAPPATPQPTQPTQPTPPAPEAQPVTPPPAVSGNLPFKIDARTGGGNMERTGYERARRAVQPASNDPGVLKHEAVHYINGELTQKLGGNSSWTNLQPGLKRAFYLWGENRYYVVPNTSVRKVEIEALVPTHLTSSHRNYFHNFDFGSRDATHILEDLSAEISTGEKTHLLFDMIIFSTAMALKMEQLNTRGTNTYWTSEGGAVLRGTLKHFFEKAAMGGDARMQRFVRDGDAKSAALRSFLKRTFGEAWCRKVLGV